MIGNGTSGAANGTNERRGGPFLLPLMSRHGSLPCLHRPPDALSCSGWCIPRWDGSGTSGRPRSKSFRNSDAAGSTPEAIER
jgi:hypothetical protein